MTASSEQSHKEGLPGFKLASQPGSCAGTEDGGDAHTCFCWQMDNTEVNRCSAPILCSNSQIISFLFACLACPSLPIITINGCPAKWQPKPYPSVDIQPGVQRWSVSGQVAWVMMTHPGRWWLSAVSAVLLSKWGLLQQGFNCTATGQEEKGCFIHWWHWHCWTQLSWAGCWASTPHSPFFKATSWGKRRLEGWRWEDRFLLFFFCSGFKMT